jgi:hypothetical protein
MAAKRIVPRSVSPEVLKLISDKPKLQESHWILEVAAKVVSPVVCGILEVLIGPIDPTPIELQQYRAKYVRQIGGQCDLPDMPEVLSGPRKCEGECGRLVWMLVHSNGLLCWNCWGKHLGLIQFSTEA